MTVRLAENCRHGRFLYLDSDRYIGHCLAVFGEYGEGEVDLFRQILRPGDVVAEVGANIGAHTVPLSKMATRVLAFEPQPFIFNVFCGNLALNGCHNVEAYRIGLSGSPGAMTLPSIDYDAVANFGGISLEPGNGPVRVETLDSFNLPALRLIKIDVEGMEAAVLRGARRTIECCRPALYVEDDRREKSAELRALIEEMGYDIHEHQPLIVGVENWRGNPDFTFDGYAVKSDNLLCLPREA